MALPALAKRARIADHPSYVRSPGMIQSDREVIAGAVERVTFHNAENGFCVLRIKARGHRDLGTVVGYAATISAGGMAEGVRRMVQRPHPWPAVQGRFSSRASVTWKTVVCLTATRSATW